MKERELMVGDIAEYSVAVYVKIQITEIYPDKNRLRGIILDSYRIDDGSTGDVYSVGSRSPIWQMSIFKKVVDPMDNLFTALDKLENEKKNL